MCDRKDNPAMMGSDEVERGLKKPVESYTQLYRKYIAVLKRIRSYRCFCNMSVFARMELTQEEQKEVAEHEAKEKIMHLQSARAKLTEGEMKALIEDITHTVKADMIKGLH